MSEMMDGAAIVSADPTETVDKVRKVRKDKGLRHKATKDIAGKTFGHLTAIRPTSKRLDHHVVWRFRCDCGKSIARPRNRVIAAVKGGYSPSCGCATPRGVDHPNSIDITGQRFGRLVALEYAPVKGKGKQRNYWVFQCDCGAKTVARSKDVKRGNTKSCGCAVVDRLESPRGTKSAPGLNAGDRFGILTVVGEEAGHVGARYFHCRCDCGGINTVRSAILVNGQVRSCGCMRGGPGKKRRQVTVAPTAAIEVVPLPESNEGGFMRFVENMRSAIIGAFRMPVRP